MIVNNLKPIENLIFENRAWEEADYPRLHMKEPETFTHTKFENFKPQEREIHLSIGYHHGKNRWHLSIYWNNTGEMKFFSSVKEIAEYIKKTYNKNPIIPERWMDINKI